MLLLCSSNEHPFPVTIDKTSLNSLIKRIVVMSLLEESHGNGFPLSISDEDFLIGEIVFTHDPDDRLQLDSETLLSVVEAILCYDATDNVLDPHINAFNMSSVDLTGTLDEPISRVIYMISKKIHCQCFEDEHLHRKTLALLEMLGHYQWDVKVVLSLASFAHIFALFWVVMQIQFDNALASSLAMIRQIPGTIRMLEPKFKALNLLVKTMLKLTKTIVCFEGVSLHHELVEDRTVSGTKSKIYLATYWIFRSILVCSSQIADLRNLSLEQVFSDSTVVAAWGLYSLGNKLNSLCHDLEQYVENCQQQIETRLYEKLIHMFKEKQADNQNVLRALFASQNEFPFKSLYSRDKISIQELKSKIVLILITKPDLLPLDKTFYLVRQTKTDQESYVIIWVPIPSTNEWSHADKTSFEFFSNRLPWLSVQKPWSLNSSVISFVQREWTFREYPVMVALDINGLVSNANAMDMVWIWGSKAFPFSFAREEQLREEAKWTMDLMINGIGPLLSEWVKEGKNLCIYGSDNLDWIKEFNQTITKLKTAAGIQLEVAYVGYKDTDKNSKTIINTIDQEDLSTRLTLSNANLFWFRLETIRRWAANHHSNSGDDIAAKAAELLEVRSGGGWAVIGGGPSKDVIQLDQERLRECAGRFSLWRENVEEMGLVGVIRGALEGCVGVKNAGMKKRFHTKKV